MKFIIASLFIFITYLLKGQTFDFPRNSLGSIEYDRFISIDSISEKDKKLNATNLYNSIKGAPYLNGNEDYFNEATGNFTKLTGFLLYEDALINKRPAGVVNGICEVVVLDSGYQVSIYGLKYSDLVRNRYGNYIPISSKIYPLETIFRQHSGKKWELKFQDINKKIIAIISYAQSILAVKK